MGNAHVFETMRGIWVWIPEKVPVGDAISGATDENLYLTRGRGKAQAIHGDAVNSQGRIFYLLFHLSSPYWATQGSRYLK